MFDKDFFTLVMEPLTWDKSSYAFSRDEKDMHPYSVVSLKDKTIIVHNVLGIDKKDLKITRKVANGVVYLVIEGATKDSLTGKDYSISSTLQLDETQLNIDNHNRIHTSDTRRLRRIIRDNKYRGHSASDTLAMWKNIRAGEEQYIFPYQEEADVMFNSALIYELAVLKQYAEPVLFGIEKDCEEYIEAKRLLKFLDYFVGIGSEHVPANSLLKEFIGGGCFQI